MITLTAEIQIQYANPIVINRNNLISMDGSIFDRSDLKMPSFGLISNTGSIKFIDTDGRIEGYAQNRRLSRGIDVSIYLNNTLYNRTQQIASLETKQWNYDNESRVVDVSLTSGLEILQETYVKDFVYDFTSKSSISAFELLSHINKKLKSDNSKHSFILMNSENYDNVTSEILKNTFIKYATIKDMTFWNALQHLAEVCQIHIYRSIDGSGTVLKYNGGN